MASFEHLEEVDLKDALVVVAFPTTGFAGSIAAHFLQRHFDLPLVAQVRADGLAGVAAVLEGVASSPVRVYGRELECKVDGPCPRLYVVTTELTLEPAMVTDLAHAVLDWAKKGQARMVLGLEGVVRQQGDDTPDVYVAGADAAIRDLLQEATGLPPAKRALITGMTGEMLLGSRDSVRVGALVVEASQEYPDGRAAAAIVQGLDPLLPGVRLDPEPLLEEARELEQRIREAQQGAALPQGQRAQHGTFI